MPMAERVKEAVEEFFDCEFELFVEFTGLIRSVCFYPWIDIEFSALRSIGVDLILVKGRVAAGRQVRTSDGTATTTETICDNDIFRCVLGSRAAVLSDIWRNSVGVGGFILHAYLFNYFSWLIMCRLFVT